jgi:hypothetical protein
MGKAYNYNNMVIPENQLDVEVNQKKHVSQ